MCRDRKEENRTLEEHKHSERAEMHKIQHRKLSKRNQMGRRKSSKQIEIVSRMPWDRSQEIRKQTIMILVITDDII